MSYRGTGNFTVRKKEGKLVNAWGTKYVAGRSNHVLGHRCLLALYPGIFLLTQRRENLGTVLVVSVIVYLVKMCARYIHTCNSTIYTPYMTLAVQWLNI